MMSSQETVHRAVRRSPRNHRTDNNDFVDAFVVDDGQQETQQQTMDYFGAHCCVRGCKNRHNNDVLLQCEAPNCDKFLHMACYQGKVVK
jgi:hypothetical protein